VLVVTLDEPVETSGSEARRTAGWTAVPVAAEIIRRTAPLLGIRPAIEHAGVPVIRPASQ
jgi:cell division protein FtsI (penicillin-binding protein 3)